MKPSREMLAPGSPSDFAPNKPRSSVFPSLFSLLILSNSNETWGMGKCMYTHSEGAWCVCVCPCVSVCVCVAFVVCVCECVDCVSAGREKFDSFYPIYGPSRPYLSTLYKNLRLDFTHRDTFTMGKLSNLWNCRSILEIHDRGREKQNTTTQRRTQETETERERERERRDERIHLALSLTLEPISHCLQSQIDTKIKES